MSTLWFAWRLLLRTPRRSVATLVGIALAAGMLGAVLFFVTASSRTMTQRAVSEVVVDVQAELEGGSGTMANALPILRAGPHVAAAERFALASFAASALNRPDRAGSTGTGALVAVDPSYLHTSAAFRLTEGTFGAGGLAISQDMGTNLGARVGDVITIQLPGKAGTLHAPVTGILNIKLADILFKPIAPQLRGLAANPPVNVVLMPFSTFQARYAAALRAQGTAGSGEVVTMSAPAVSTQIHLLLDRGAIPSDPAQAQTWLTGLRRDLEKPFAGQVVVADNLSGALDQARSDTIWAIVIFVFLALPGVALAGVFARGATAGYLEVQRPEFALLRARGVDSRLLLTLIGTAMAGLVIIGTLIGLALGLLAVRLAPGVEVTLDAALLRSAGLALAGSLLVAALATLVPLRDLLAEEVVEARRRVARTERAPLWRRLYLDVALLVAGLVVYRITIANGFHPVLNGEGNPTLSLSLYTFLAPLLFWTGAVLFGLRLVTASLARLRPVTSRVLAGGGIGAYVLAGVSRRIGPLARTAVLTAMALSFAVSLSIVATTYNQQQRVDAQLTLGADIKVTPPPGHEGDPALVGKLGGPGVAAISPFGTTVAYVGTEIQDIFAIDVASLRRATSFSDSFFQTGTADQTLSRLAATPDGILVSDETANNYSMAVGDRINLRLFNVHSKRYVLAPFHMAGVATEFPTAPKDAFLVANRAYVARITGNPNPSFYLVRADGDPGALAARLRAELPLGSAVQHTGEVSGLLATSLTAINLNGLATIEGAFALGVLCLGLATFLVSAVGERRREFAVLAALGAAPRQAAAFLLAEVGLVVAVGLLVGLVVGRLLAGMLVIILAGVFDPPPTAPIIGWGELGLQLVLALVAVALATVVGLVRLRTLTPGDTLREA
jgi:putative ABC transport system permease protein